MSHEFTGPLRLAGEVLPIVGPMRVYVCGVTPYDVTHLGHAATFVWVDALSRLMRQVGVDVITTRNVTDVDDVLTRAAREAGTPYDQFAAMHQFRFEHDMAALGVARPDHEPRAHRYIAAVVRLAQALLDRGVAYERGGTVYHRGGPVVADCGMSDVDARAGLSVFGEDLDDPLKDDPLDVPVWRASSGDDPAWPSPWGPGRPGWHAECAAMVLSIIGPSLDVHAGGADLAFPHHAFEAAHAQAATGVAPFARSWMHVGTVRIDGHKMAKSTGNLVLVDDLLRDHSPSAVRLMLLNRPWAQAWDFAPALLDDAAAVIDTLHAAAARPALSDAASAAMMQRLLDDLDVPGAIDIATESGGAAARTLIHVFGLG